MKRERTTSSSQGKSESERLSAASFAVANRTTTRECSSADWGCFVEDIISCMWLQSYLPQNQEDKTEFVSVHFADARHLQLNYHLKNSCS